MLETEESQKAEEQSPKEVVLEFLSRPRRILKEVDFLTV